MIASLASGCAVVSYDHRGWGAAAALLLDALIMRLHTETACRRGGGLALRPQDLDVEQCLVLLREKGVLARRLGGFLCPRPTAPKSQRALLLTRDFALDALAG